VGKTKVFFRKEAYDYLEAMRGNVLRNAAVKCQRIARGYLARQLRKRLIACAVKIQTAIRASLARRKVHHIRIMRAATLMQSAWRRYSAQTMLQHALYATISIQAAFRGAKDRQIALKMRERRDVISIQSFWKGSIARQRYMRLKMRAIQLQCFWRAVSARQVLRNLKQEARSAVAAREENVQLRNRVKHLEQLLERAEERANAAEQALAARK